MKFNFHNKLEIETNGKKFVFFNTMLKSVFSKLKNLESYASFVSVGTGTGDRESENKLSNFEKSYCLETEILQSDISISPIFSKKTVTIDDKSLDGKFLTEIGLSDGDETDPVLIDFFSLVSDDFPNGIEKQENSSLVISIYIYLELTESGEFMITKGKNKFVEFLLGEGISGTIYACRGTNISSNERITREKPSTDEKFECTLTCEEADELTLSFSADIETGQTYEIVFLVDDNPFARINVQEFKEPVTTTESLTAKTNYIIDLGENVKSFGEVTNVTTGEVEDSSTIYAKAYANDFADKITLPFHGIFDNTTARFLSKDGDKIFFVLDDTIYGYINENLTITQIETGGLSIQNISKIISFDKYVFVAVKTEPYLRAFLIEENKLEEVSIDLSDFDYYSSFGEIYDIDITLANNGNFMIGVILSETQYGYAIYLTYDETSKSFLYDSYLYSEYYFSYVLAMYKNNFTDATLYFLRSGETQVACRLVEFSSEKKKTDVYTILAYYYASTNTKELYVKNRAIIVETNTTPKLYIYYYPQVYKFSLENLNDEIDDFLSTNLLYLIQKISESEYKIYNLVGYDTPTEFLEGFPKEIDQSKILDFEFLNDTLLIFMNDSTEPIVGYNLKETSMLIENVSSNEDEYQSDITKYNLLGDNNEGVKVELTLTITI